MVSRADAGMVNSRWLGSRNQPYRALSFGGWGDYQEWANNDFVRRPVDRAPLEDPVAGPPVVPTQAEAADHDWYGNDKFASEASRHPADSRRYSENDYPARPPIADRLAEPQEEIDSRLTMARPYVRTGGRARADYDLRIETMISTKRISVTGYGRHDLSPDHQLICRLCEVPKSVAEVAAQIHAPLGVARVLIGDAITLNLLTMHEIATTVDGRPSMDLLRRVYDGLVRLE
ncbi:MAG: hypothetical protein QOI21_2329 [Actinomycetota bacterium]|jgi:hypothetical protein|nr:hypothetical protein [Actinomycetota bacterium]